MSEESPEPEDDPISGAETINASDASNAADADTVYARTPSNALAATLVPNTTPSSARPVEVASVTLRDYGFADRYAQGKMLGRGGMGEVKLCSDQQTGRQVAMKVMRKRDPAGPGSDSALRFVREARVQAQLEHPSIVPVYDLGVGPDGAPYFTMKRLRGMTLASILRGQREGEQELIARYSRRKLLTDFGNVCQAIEYAHSRGVLHRDLKPENIMLGDFGAVYVLDWGLAKLSSAGEEESVSVRDMAAAHAELTADETAYGAVMGTPGYMPPEQMRGEQDKLDARADIYALGSILFELLTLQPLHRRDGDKSVMQSTLEGADARARMRSKDRDVAPELESICVRATATLRAERFASVGEMHDELERYLDGDRDVARRKQVAAEYANSARLALQVALSNDGGAAAARTEALHFANRALALDPTDEVAVGIITRLLLEPPRETPSEVQTAIADSMHASSLREMRAGMRGYAAFAAFIPLYIWMGVRDWFVTGLALGTFALIVGMTVWGIRRKVCTSPMVYIVMLLHAVLLGLLTRTFGPYVMIPGMAAVITMGFLFHSHLQRPAITIALGCSAVLVPVALEWAGILGASYAYVGNNLVIAPHLTDMPPLATQLTLLAHSLAIVLTAGVFIVEMRSSQLDAERRMFLHSWQLRQLIPRRALASVPTPMMDSGDNDCPIMGPCAPI